MELLGQDNTTITAACQIQSSPPATVPINEETLLRRTISKGQVKYSQLLLDMSKMSTATLIEDLNVSNLDVSYKSNKVSRMIDMDTHKDEASDGSHSSTAPSQECAHTTDMGTHNNPKTPGTDCHQKSRSPRAKFIKDNNSTHLPRCVNNSPPIDNM